MPVSSGGIYQLTKQKRMDVVRLTSSDTENVQQPSNFNQLHILIYFFVEAPDSCMELIYNFTPLNAKINCYKDQNVLGKKKKKGVNIVIHVRDHNHTIYF